MFFTLCFAYLDMLNYDGDAKKLLDAPFNASTFPSSFFLTCREPHYTMSLPNGPVCFPDLMNEENADGLTNEENRVRSKYNFVYTKNGVR